MNVSGTGLVLSEQSLYLFRSKHNNICIDLFFLNYHENAEFPFAFICACPSHLSFSSVWSLFLMLAGIAQKYATPIAMKWTRWL